MDRLQTDTFPDSVNQTLDYMKGQPFQYVALIATSDENYYQGFRITPKTHGQVLVWIKKLEEMAQELREQIEHQSKE